MKPDFIKNFSQRMVFDLIVSALVTVLVVTLTDRILTFFGNGLMNIGYRSAWTYTPSAYTLNSVPGAPY